MTQKALFLLALLAAPSAFASEAGEASIQRIEKACRRELAGEAKNPAAVCGCVKKNYLGAQFNDEELELMARSHEQDPKAEEALQAQAYEDLILFDYDVAEGCLKQPRFQLKK